MKYQNAIVVGGSSGIGKELVKQLIAAGTRVANVSRRPSLIDGALDFQHDVTSFKEVPALFQQITRQLGGLDLIVYCAGAMPEVGKEEFDWAKDKQMLETNLLGCVAWMDAAAARFQGVGAGTMVAIGSVAGDRGRAGQPVYNASKAAVATYMEALRNRLTKKGVTVVTIKPGPTQTEMTAHLDMKNAMSAEDVARITLKKAAKPGEHYIKLTHRVIFAIIRLIPGPIFRKLPL